MRFLSIVLLIFVVVIFSAMTLAGLVPVLSDLVGASQKDLGIRSSQEETDKVIAKIGTEIVVLPSTTKDSEGFRLEGKKSAEFTMTYEELSASSNNRPWKNYPLRNAQIKIHDDGLIEGSAILVISKAMSYALNLGYSEEQIKDAMAKYNIPPFEVPIYIKGYGSVENDRVHVDAKDVKIGAVTVPSYLVTQASGEAEKVLDDLIKKHSDSFHADYVTFKNGEMQFKGTVAEKEYVIGN